MARRPGKCFDTESGQVYTETICKAGPMTPDWTWKTRGSITDLAKHANPGTGCSSLRSMSIRCFLINSWNITAATLESLPLHLVRRIWKAAKH